MMEHLTQVALPDTKAPGNRAGAFRAFSGDSADRTAAMILSDAALDNGDPRTRDRQHVRDDGPWITEVASALRDQFHQTIECYLDGMPPRPNNDDLRLMNPQVVHQIDYSIGQPVVQPHGAGVGDLQPRMVVAHQDAFPFRPAGSLWVLHRALLPEIATG